MTIAVEYKSRTHLQSRNGAMGIKSSSLGGDQVVVIGPAVDCRAPVITSSEMDDHLGKSSSRTQAAGLGRRHFRGTSIGASMKA